MPAKKSPATKKNPNNPENPVQILKEGTCPTSSGKSNLGYQIGVDESGVIQLRVSSNDGGGFFSNEWIAFTGIQVAINDWPEHQGITSMTFRKLFRGKSANTPGFLIAVLVAEGLLESMADRKRVHQACHPAPFLASVDALRKGTATPTKPKAKAKAAPKAKAASKVKAKTPRKPTAKTAKTPRKSN
jgi:hypothetical protein